MLRISTVLAAVVCLALSAGSSARTTGTLIDTNQPWHCDRPLSQYGELPITVRQTIDNSSPAGHSDR